MKRKEEENNAGMNEPGKTMYEQAVVPVCNVEEYLLNEKPVK